MSNKMNYDDIALMMTAATSVIAILGLVLALKSGLTGNFFLTEQNKVIDITQPLETYTGSQTFYCKDDKAFALWKRTTVDIVMQLGYSCTQSDINKEVTCCWPPEE